MRYHRQINISHLVAIYSIDFFEDSVLKCLLEDMDPRKVLLLGLDRQASPHHHAELDPLCKESLPDLPEPWEVEERLEVLQVDPLLCG